MDAFRPAEVQEILAASVFGAELINQLPEVHCWPYLLICLLDGHQETPMPRSKKKHPKDWTTEEAMRKMFPKKAREHLKKEAEKRSGPQVRPSSPSIDREST